MRPLSKVTEAAGHVYRESKVSVLDRLQGVVTSSEGVGSLQLFYLLLSWVKPDWHVTLSLLQSFTDGRMDADMADEDDVPMKKQKVLERCKFWPVCKSGDECMYHHPTAQCKWVALIEKGQITKALKVHWGLIECCVFGGFSGLFQIASLGINACLCILTVNMTLAAQSQTVPSLTSAAEALLLLHSDQVRFHYPYS